MKKMCYTQEEKNSTAGISAKMTVLAQNVFKLQKEF